VQIIEKPPKMHGSLPATFLLSMQGLLHKRRSLCTPRQTISPPLHARPCTTTLSALPLSKGGWFTSAWLRDQACYVGLHSPQKTTDAVNLRETDYSADQTNAHPIVCHEPTLIPSAHPCVMSKKMYKSPPSRYGLDYIACLRELLATGWSDDTVLGPVQTDADWLFTHPGMDAVPTTLYAWIARFICTFEVLGVPEKLGLMILYGRYFKVRYTYGLQKLSLTKTSGW
jgi:hypothetical protein